MGIAAIALIIGFGILLAREYEEGVLLTLFCAAMNYIAIPLIILFLENIIPLLILIVVGIIIGFVIGLGESGGSSVGESSVSRTESREPSSSPALSIDELENIVKSRNNSSKMSILVIDDLWLMATQNTYITKKEEIEEILSKIKQLVEQEIITVLALVLLSKYAPNNYSLRKELESYGNFIRWADLIVKSSSEI